MSASTDPLYHLDAARTEEQRARMAALEADRVCVFCNGEQAVVHSGDWWYVTENAYPYAGTTAHYLIVPHLHVSSFDELPDEAGAELWAMKRWLKDRLAPPAVATVERSGDMRFNGGSVAHLHVHFVALEREPAETVRFRVSAHARPAASTNR